MISRHVFIVILVMLSLVVTCSSNASAVLTLVHAITSPLKLNSEAENNNNKNINKNIKSSHDLDAVSVSVSGLEVHRPLDILSRAHRSAPSVDESNFVTTLSAPTSSLSSSSLLTSTSAQANSVHRFEATFQGKCGRDSPCEHVCFDLHDGLTYECACNEGYTLNLDGYSCSSSSSLLIKSNARNVSPRPTSTTRTTTTTTSELTKASQLTTTATTSTTAELTTTISEGGRGRTDPEIIAGKLDDDRVDGVWYMDCDTLDDDLKLNMALNDQLLDELADILTTDNRDETDQLNSMKKLINKTHYYDLLWNTQSGSSVVDQIKIRDHDNDKLALKSSETPVSRKIRHEPNESIEGIKAHPVQSQTKQTSSKPFVTVEPKWGYPIVTTSLCQQVECESGGNCVVEPSLRVRCRCPLGRGGRLCQRPVQVAVPRFRNQSYLALPMISDDWSLEHLVIEFKPERIQDSMLLFTDTGIADSTSADDYYFMALFLRRDASVKFVSRERRAPNWTINTISSSQVQPNQWNRVVVRPVVARSLQKTNQYNRRSVNSVSRQLFMGGMPNMTQFSERFQIASGFDGCVRSLTLNGHRYDFRSDSHGDSLDGIDIDECIKYPGRDADPKASRDQHLACIRSATDPVQCLCHAGLDLDRCLNEILIEYEAHSQL